MEISQGREEDLTSLRGPKRKDFPGAPVKTSRQVCPFPYPGKKNPWTSDSFCCRRGLSPSHAKGHMTLSLFSLPGPQLPHLRKMQLKPATLRSSCEDPKDNVWRCLVHLNTATLPSRQGYKQSALPLPSHLKLGNGDGTRAPRTGA